MRTHKYKGLMATIKYNICGDGYDAEVRANNIFNVVKNRIDKAYDKGRADAIDEFTERLLEELIPMKDKKFDIAKGTAMPERYTHLKLMDTLDMVIEMVKIKAEQLKEKKE